MKKLLILLLRKTRSSTPVSAHCDGPCGVYDPAQAQVAGEAVLAMTKKLIALDKESTDKTDLNYLHNFTRFTSIKESEAEKAKHHLTVLWADYFKPTHLEKYPDLHTLFWNALKTASSCKQEISETHANELLDYIQQVHKIFWETKGKDVSWRETS